MQLERIERIDESSPLYPSAWSELSDAPKTLYALGDTSLLTTRIFAVVGSRRISPTIAKTGEKIVKDLSYAFTVATGTADGGDSSAIEGALSGSGKVICLLAGGFSALPQGTLALLERVAKRGLILSPHPYQTPVRNYSYEYRNKLLACLSEGVLVLSAGHKSGALITANHAKRFEKPVFAIPYPPLSASGEGCNALIKGGAHLTESAQDVFDRFDITVRSDLSSAPTLTADEQTLYAVLLSRGESHVTDLVSLTPFPLFRLRSLLSALEVKGVVVSVGGNRFAPV